MRDICIVDYGLGNLSSVASALSFLGYRATVTADPHRLGRADGLILPGVGAFGQAMRQLRERNLIAALERSVFGMGTPILGICLGMQLLARSATEGGLHQGLGWIDATVDRLPDAPGIRIPHIGWNEVTWSEGAMLGRNLTENAHFYFNHTYCMVADADVVTATTRFGGPVVAAVSRANVFGTQFHPEKSQTNGLRVLRNFLNHVEASGRAAVA